MRRPLILDTNRGILTS